MYSNDKTKLSKIRNLSLRLIAGLTFILVIIINAKIIKTKISFMASKVINT